MLEEKCWWVVVFSQTPAAAQARAARQEFVWLMSQINILPTSLNSIVTGAAAALSLCLPEPASVKLEKNYCL